MRSFRTFLAIAVLGVAFTAIGASSALAAEVHPFVSSFNGEATPAQSMSATGVAVDNSCEQHLPAPLPEPQCKEADPSNGDVYVSDVGNGVLDKFSGSGTYLSQLKETPSGPFGVLYGQDAVNASGDVFVPDLFGGVGEFDPSGAYVPPQIPLGSEGYAVGVAVNGTGEVFVASGVSKLYKYDPVTQAVSTFATGFTGAYGVAVDDDPSSPAYGHVYVVDNPAGVVDVFDSSGTRLSQLTAPSGSFNAVVDPATGDVYVAGEHVVYEYGPTGVRMSKIPTSGEFLTSVAVNATSGDVYVSGSAGVEIFGPPVIAPDATTSSPTGVQPTEVTLQGHVDPAGAGEVTSCRFEYGTSTSYGETAACSPAAPYTVPTNVSATVGGLSPDTEYHYRLSAANANGTNESEDGTFETTGPPTIGEQSADRITQSTAMLHAQLNPHGIDTHYRFEYGPTTSYGTSVPVPDGDAGAGATPVQVSAQATGLSLSTTYHYRLVAENGVGPAVEGPDGEFTSRPFAVVEGPSAVAGPNEARLRARVEDFGAPTDCEVEYVTDAQFVSAGYQAPTIALCTPPHLAGVERELHPMAEISGLNANTTYHYRFLISNSYGESRTADQTFITFGFAAFSFEAREQGSNGHYLQEPTRWFEVPGPPSTQAGAHPWVLETNIALNTNGSAEEGPAGTVRDIRVHLPAGLIGNPQAVPKCTRHDSERQECSADSEIGEVRVVWAGHGHEFGPLFNLVPPRGVAAEFGVRFSKIASAFIVGRVRTGSDYGLDADTLNITTFVAVTGVQVRVWGVPADPSHNAERQCPTGNASYTSPFLGCSTSAPLRPFLTNPSSCTGPLSASVQADTFQAPGEFAQLGTEVPAMTGCERLHFTPSITVAPESSAADSPTGLHVDLHVPQNENPAGLAEADLKDATVTLPAGVTVNPATAGGLTGCSEAQLELHGPSPAACPNSSKVGTVELLSPLVDHPLKGSVYVAQQGNGGPAQGSNPFGSLLAIYIAIADEETGVVIKLAGKVTADPVTGRLTTTFTENPQLPFEDLKLDFFGGPRAALATPPVCGSYAASASLASWAEPGTPVTPGVAPFAISTGPGGGACPSGGFAPSFMAGTTVAQAGAFAPFALSLSRNDGEATLGAVTTTLPAGLAGMLSKVPLCGEAQANAGECPVASQIGHVTTSAGVGSAPIVLPAAGRPADPVYLTGPYKGTPFGLAFVVAAEAGPFNLGRVVVRARIMVDPHTARVTVVSDPLPTILQGIPLDVRGVDVTIDRPEFMFNPTSCEPMSIAGTVASAQGATANVSSPFQVANCAALAFKPKFTASTSSKTSRKDGASLDVKLSYPNTPEGTEANAAKVKVELPKALPSRLPTLQKACTAAQFESNPAGCPPESIVGHAKATSPLVPVPLEGPAYFVSHGGEAFPSLIMVLQGYGLTLELVGSTYISKSGITSSTFKAIPDVPVATFELTLPRGPYSALGANTDLCGDRRLAMGTEMIAQNGAEIHQSTPIVVSGCRPAIKVLRHAVSGKTATIAVSVPSAGRLVATGRGLDRASAKAGAAGTVTLKLTLSGAEQRFLAKHHGRRLKVTVRLRFTPAHGPGLTGHVSLLIG
jgi:hypothetical protein